MNIEIKLSGSKAELDAHLTAAGLILKPHNSRYGWDFSAVYVDVGGAVEKVGVLNRATTNNPCIVEIDVSRLSVDTIRHLVLTAD